MATAVVGGLIAAGGAAVGGVAIGGVIAAGALGALSGALQDRAERKRGEAQKRAVAEQRKQQAISNAQQAVARSRAIRQSIAQSRVARAELESRAFAGGPEGVGQSITGDTASAVGAAQTQEATQFGISQSQDRQAQFQLQAQSANRFDTLAGVANLGLTGLNLQQQGAFSGLGSLFGGGNAAPAPAGGGFSGNFGNTF